MENVLRAIRSFFELRNEASEYEFQLCFIELIQAIIEFVGINMCEERFNRNIANEFYDMIYENIHQMEANLSEYQHAILEEYQHAILEEQSENEENE